MTFTERREATKAKLRSLVDVWKSKYGYRPPKDALDFHKQERKCGFMTVPEPSKLTRVLEGGKYMPCLANRKHSVFPS